MLTLKKIAVTGGLSCGKSIVCRLFQQLGACVVSADEIVHQLLTPDSESGKRVIEWLGPTIVRKGQIDRNQIAEIVFSDPAKVKKLESWLHPGVRAIIKQAYEDANKTSTFSFFVAEIPLLFEAAMEKDFDWVITVSSSPEMALERFKGSPEEFNRRSALQMPLDEKMKKSDYILFNNGSKDELALQVQQLYNHLKSHES